MLSPESFPKCGTVDAKTRKIPGRPGSSIILGSMDDRNLHFKTESLDRIRTKYSETN